MNDEEVLNAMRKTLSDVRMDRPVEAIEGRGRARRRNRGLLAAAAGGALAAVGAFALMVPLGSSNAGSAPAGDTEAAGTAAAPAMEEVAFSVNKQTNGSVRLTLKSKLVINPEKLEKALAEAGVPAVVKAGELCTPKGDQLPQIKKVVGFEPTKGVDEDGVSGGSNWVISPAKMPEGSVLYFSAFPIRQGGDYAKVGLFLVEKDAAMYCRSVV